MNRLTEDELVRILREPKNCLADQYRRLFSTWNVNLEFSDEAFHSVARLVMDRHTGARGLKFVMVKPGVDFNIMTMLHFVYKITIKNCFRLYKLLITF